MKWLQWGITGALLALVLGTSAAYLATRESSRPRAKTAASDAGEVPLVDERPLPTARALAALAITPEEQRLAQEAVRIADHEVDLAFAVALRQAAELRPAQDPKNRDLYSKMQQAQTALADVLSRLEQLKAKISSAKPSERDALQDQKDLLDAEQALDEDEIEDAQQELIRSGGDQETAVQRQRDQHEAGEHEFEQHQGQTPAAPAPAVNLNASNLAGQVRAWMWLRDKRARIESARSQAEENGNGLAEQHQALQGRVHEQKPQREETKQRAANLRKGAAAGAASKEDTATAVNSLKHFSSDQKLLSDFDKRIQDQQELRQIYGNWLDVTASQQRAAVHSMLRSVLWILLVVVLVYCGSLLANRVYTQAGPEKKHLLTLRGVVRFALQAVGVLVIAFVILGVPNQMPTILGLAGAGLTVALKDFIVGFFGWFVLMGRNGIRVGDWVEINGVVGEVIEIGLLRTVLLETGNWTDTGHPTGRKVAFVNSFAIEGHFFNFSTAGQWLWDELQVVVGQGENPYPLVEAIQRLVEEETRASAAQAEQEWQKSAGYRKSLAVAPAIHLRPTAAGVEMQIRYITSANERYVTRSRLYEKIVGLLRGEQKPEAAVPGQQA
ncbi:MAG TPA: mechanosensitive ion channel domain-containing protein [Terriglobales bacterium]|nr:mechanosensitive ion channel domain-containing protein [Terriglobales bacterium]